jgi:hypothetical protein
MAVSGCFPEQVHVEAVYIRDYATNFVYEHTGKGINKVVRVY